MPSHPESIHHTYPTETFTEALECLYEDTVISKTVLVCLNDDSVMEYTRALSALNHTVLPVLTRDPLSVAIQRFKETQNTILVISLGRCNGMNESSFQTFLATGWNVLASVDVPLYHMDAVLHRCFSLLPEAGTAETLHLLWFRH